MGQAGQVDTWDIVKAVQKRLRKRRACIGTSDCMGACGDLNYERFTELAD